MIADKMVNKLNAREEKIKEKYFDDEISETKYIFSGGFVQGMLEGFLDGRSIVGAITITAQLGSMIYKGFKKEDKQWIYLLVY